MYVTHATRNAHVSVYQQMSQGRTMTYVFELDILPFNLKLDRYIGVIKLVLYL